MRVRAREEREWSFAHHSLLSGSYFSISDCSAKSLAPPRKLGGGVLFLLNLDIARKHKNLGTGLREL